MEKVAALLVGGMLTRGKATPSLGVPVRVFVPLEERRTATST